MMDRMDNDLIFFICCFAVVVGGAFLVFYAIIHIFQKKWERETQHTATPWFRRVK